MKVIVNGKPRTTGAAAEMSLLDFLAANDVNPKLVAVAINGDVIPKSTFTAAVVRDGDDIEIVRMVGGGAGDPGDSRSAGFQPARCSREAAADRDERTL